jgi:uncharacterized membrane protein
MIAILAGVRVALGQGGPLVQIPLLTHVAAGMAGIVTGYVALFTAKGSAAHRTAGRWFVYAMLVMGLVGAAIAAFERKLGSVDGGLLAAYLVVTGLLTVREPTDATRRVERVGMLLALAVGSTNVALGLQAALRGASGRDGVPLPAYFVFGGIALLCALGDARMLRRGRPRGTPRLVRHLWRMSFATFVATGSFFLGQAHVIPKPLRVWSVLFVLAFLPLVAMLYWLWRVRIRRSLRGLALVPNALRGAEAVGR